MTPYTPKPGSVADVVLRALSIDGAPERIYRAEVAKTLGKKTSNVELCCISALLAGALVREREGRRAGPGVVLASPEYPMTLVEPAWRREQAVLMALRASGRTLTAFQVAQALGMSTSGAYKILASMTRDGRIRARAGARRKRPGARPIRYEVAA